MNVAPAAFTLKTAEQVGLSLEVKKKTPTGGDNNSKDFIIDFL